MRAGTRPPAPWHAHLGFGAALVALAWAFWAAPQPAPPAFAPPPAPTPLASAGTPLFATELLPGAGASAHAASLALLADGRLAAAWFAGSREGAEDVAIYLSLRSTDGTWSPPRVIASRAQSAQELRRHLRKLGNPLLHTDSGGRLHLHFVSVSLGGWAGSAINHKYSDDGGQTWSPAERLVTSPFFNISTLVRTPPLALADGGLGLPAYHEFVAKQGEWLRLDAAGRLVDKQRLPQARAALQPAVVALDPARALALLRDAGPGKGQVLAARSGDGGASWQAEPALPLGNPNSAVALLRLGDGSLLLAGNPAQGRASLLLHRSRDEGRSWEDLGAIEAGVERRDEIVEFSYPSLVEDRDGSIHLAYTWNRRGIRHVVFDRAWLEARRAAPTQPAIPEARP